MKRSIIIILAVILFIGALGLTFYPIVSNYVNSKGESINGYYPFAEGLFNDIPTEIKRPER